MNRSRSLYFTILLICSIGAAYHNTLGSPFVFDDLINIVKNPYIQIDDLSPQSLQKVFSRFQPSETRPVANLSFALNYLAGGYDPLGYHIVNILIHTLTSIILLFLFTWYFSRSGYSSSMAQILAFFACAIWALNPIQTNGVTYIVQRMTSLCTLFFVSSLSLYVLARSKPLWDSSGRFCFRTAGHYFLSFLFWVLALLSKEIAAILPAIIVLHEISFFRSGGWKKLFACKGIILAAIILPLIAGILWRGPDFLNVILGKYELRDFTLTERLLTEPRVVIRYMSLFLFPLPSRLTLFYDFPLSHSIFEPPSTIVSIGGIIGMILFSVVFMEKYRLISFGLLWTLVCLVIESTVIPLEIIFEHRFYLPSIGFSLAVVTLLYTCIQYISRSKTLLYFVILISLVALTFNTYARNTTWKSEISLSQDAVEKEPANIRARIALARAFFAKQNYGEGVKALHEAFILDPNHIFVLSYLYVHYYNINSPAESEYYLSLLLQSVDKVSAQICKYEWAIDTVSRILFREKRYNDVVYLLEKIKGCNEKPAVFYWNLAQAYNFIGNLEQTISNVEICVKLDPQNPQYLYSLAMYYSKAGAPNRAVEVLMLLKSMNSTQKVDGYIRKLEQDLLAE